MFSCYYLTPHIVQSTFVCCALHAHPMLFVSINVEIKSDLIAFFFSCYFVLFTVCTRHRCDQRKREGEKGIKITLSIHNSNVCLYQGILLKIYSHDKVCILHNNNEFICNHIFVFKCFFIFFGFHTKMSFFDAGACSTFRKTEPKQMCIMTVRNI